MKDAVAIWSRSSSVRTKSDQRWTDSKGMRPKGTWVKSIWSGGKSRSKGTKAVASLWVWGSEKRPRERARESSGRRDQKGRQGGLGQTGSFRPLETSKMRNHCSTSSKQVTDTVWTTLLRICLGSCVKDRLGRAGPGGQGWKQGSCDYSQAGDTRRCRPCGGWQWRREHAVGVWKHCYDRTNRISWQTGCGASEKEMPPSLLPWAPEKWHGHQLKQDRLWAEQILWREGADQEFWSGRVESETSSTYPHGNVK